MSNETPRGQPPPDRTGEEDDHRARLSAGVARQTRLAPSPAQRYSVQGIIALLKDKCGSSQAVPPGGKPLEESKNQDPRVSNPSRSENDEN